MVDSDPAMLIDVHGVTVAHSTRQLYPLLVWRHLRMVFHALVTSKGPILSRVSTGGTLILPALAVSYKWHKALTCWSSPHSSGPDRCASVLDGQHQSTSQCCGFWGQVNARRRWGRSRTGQEEGGWGEDQAWEWGGDGGKSAAKSYAPPKPGRPTQVSLSLQALNARCRSKETHCCQLQSTQSKHSLFPRGLQQQPFQHCFSPGRSRGFRTELPMRLL